MNDDWPYSELRDNEVGFTTHDSDNPCPYNPRVEEIIRNCPAFRDEGSAVAVDNARSTIDELFQKDK